jgi:flagellar operon protein
VELKKISQLQEVVSPRVTPALNPEVGSGPSFKETLKNFQDPSLEKSSLNSSGLQSLKFSNHAVDRMMSRGIRYSPEDLQKLQSAVEKAASKGAKDSLILMNDTALIVSVKNKTVVTVMDQAALKENVFTNIDSTIVI